MGKRRPAKEPASSVEDGPWWLQIINGVGVWARRCSVAAQRPVGTAVVVGAIRTEAVSAPALAVPLLPHIPKPETPARCSAIRPRSAVILCAFRKVPGVALVV